MPKEDQPADAFANRYTPLIKDADPGKTVIFVERTNLPEHAKVISSAREEIDKLDRKIRDLQLEREIAERRLENIRNLDTLFDSKDLFKISIQLHNLTHSGIANIKVGKWNYSMEELERILDSAEKFAQKNLHTYYLHRASKCHCNTALCHSGQKWFYHSYHTRQNQEHARQVYRRVLAESKVD